MVEQTPSPNTEGPGVQKTVPLETRGDALQGAEAKKENIPAAPTPENLAEEIPSEVSKKNNREGQTYVAAALQKIEALSQHRA